MYCNPQGHCKNKKHHPCSGTRDKWLILKSTRRPGRDKAIDSSVSAPIDGTNLTQTVLMEGYVVETTIRQTRGILQPHGYASVLAKKLFSNQK